MSKDQEVDTIILDRWFTVQFPTDAMVILSTVANQSAAFALDSD